MRGARRVAGAGLRVGRLAQRGARRASVRLVGLAGPLVPRAIILLYHRVADVTSDPQMLCVSPAHFAEHLEVIRGRCRPLILADLGRSLGEKSIPHRGVAVTFDDGYADNLCNARPLLEKAGVPAMVFVTTGYVEKQREFWWDEVERVLLTKDNLPEVLEMDRRGTRLTFPMRTAGERRVAYDSIIEWLRLLDSGSIQQVLCALGGWAGDKGEPRPSHRPLRPEEIAALAADGLLQVGAHTRNHVSLAAQPEEVQVDEITGSRRDLEAWLGRPVTEFAYPFGTRGDYSRSTVRAVREAGFRMACSNFVGWVTRWAQPYQLPRCLVRDWDGETFARFLEDRLRG